MKTSSLAILVLALALPVMRSEAQAVPAKHIPGKVHCMAMTPSCGYKKPMPVKPVINVKPHKPTPTR